MPWIVVLILAAGFATSAKAGCRIEPRGTVPVSLVGRTPLVQVMVNGAPLRFVLDTGAERSILSEEAAKRIGVIRDEWAGTTLSGVSGIVRRPNAIPRTLTLGGVALVRQRLSHDVSLAVVPTLAGGFGAIADGLLGRDYLSSFDLDLDSAHGSLALMAVTDCSGQYLPWRGRYTSIPVEAIKGAPLVIMARIDGVRVRALLDTGAGNSVLTASGIHRMKLDDRLMDADPSMVVTGVGLHAVTVRQHRFDALEVGGVVSDQPEIWAAQIYPTPIVDMLLGMDWVIRQRIWVSFSGHAVFVALPE